MQTLNAPPRQAYTVDQVKALLRDSPGLRIDKGLEVIDEDLNVLQDVSAFLRDGSVSRSSYATLHGTCNLAISTELDWGRDIIRPYMIVTDAYGNTPMRWNLGAYYMAIPDRTVKENPPTYTVEGYDILQRLATPVGGGAYSVNVGESYVQAAVDVLNAQGFTAPVVDQTNADLLLTTARVWAIDPNITWLTVVNDLLGAVGYQGIWSDWDGQLHVQAYAAPSTRGSEFYYDADLHTSLMADDLAVSENYFATPNMWVWVRSNDIEGPAPVEGDGIATYVNEHVGKTSVQARRRTITRVEFVEAANQTALENRLAQAVAADQQTSAKVTVSTPPMPAHWHFDRLTVSDPRIGPPLDVVGTQWTLPLSGGDMKHEWTVLG